MSFPRKSEHLDALDERLGQLDVALGDGDMVATWRLVRDVLGWLHRSKEQARQDIGHEKLAALMTASPDGQALDGLMWVRALADHHGADVQTEMLKPVRIGRRRRADGHVEWFEIEVLVNGEPVRAGPPQVAFPCWPRRTDLPAGNPGRERAAGHYDLQAAARPIVPPIEAARRFLGSL